MRIIKDSPTAMLAIAGEMINIEGSTLRYIDGEAVDPTTGYPRINVGTVHHIIRAASGYIFIPDDMSIEVFEVAIMKLIGRMGQEPTRYKTISNGYHTNTKILSNQRVTKYNRELPNRWARQDADSNVARQFTRTPVETPALFTWIVTHLSETNFEVSGSNIPDAISRHACSILFDRDDICTLAHNDITMEFTPALMRGCGRLITDETVRLWGDDPTLVELSKHWSATHPGHTFINIPPARLFEGVYDCLMLAHADGVESDSPACTQCKSMLWGDNYVAYGELEDPDNMYSEAYCPFCAHCYQETILTKYSRLLRVTFPHTREDALAQLTDTKRDILGEMAQGVQYYKHTIGEATATYATIGTKYVAFQHVSLFLYTALATHPDLAGRRVITWLPISW